MTFRVSLGGPNRRLLDTSRQSGRSWSRRSSNFEDGHADRSRYATVGARDPETGARSDRSFAKPREVSIARILENLEVFIGEATELVGVCGVESWSALQDLAMESRQLAQDLHRRGLL